MGVVQTQLFWNVLKKGSRTNSKNFDFEMEVVRTERSLKYFERGVARTTTRDAEKLKNISLKKKDPYILEDFWNILKEKLSGLEDFWNILIKDT